MSSAPVLERTFAVDADGRCRLRVPRTHVHLEADADLEAAPDRDDAEVRLTLTAPDRGAGSSSVAAARAFADTLRVGHADGVVRVEPKTPPRPNARDWRALRDGPPLLRLRVHIPSGLDADVHVSSGSVEARGLGGAVTLEADDSPVHAVGLSGRLDVRARCSPTTVEAFTGAECQANVSGGPLTLRDVAAGSVEIESRAARLRLDDLRLDDFDAGLRLTAHQGAVDVAGLRGSLDAAIYGGRGRLTPLGGSPVRLHAPGSDAHLHLEDDLAADLRLSADRLDWHAPKRFDGEREPRRIEGALDGRGDGALIEAHAPGGTLRCVEE